MSLNHQPSDEQRETAAFWLAKRTGSILSPAEELEFETWLNEDRNHRLAWDEMRVLWAHLEQPAEQVALIRPPRGAFMHYCSGLRGRLTICGGIVTAILAIFIISPNFIEDFQADIVSGKEFATPVTLPDGSRVQMAANSALALEFTPYQRHVRLLRGEAFFEVTPGSAPDFSINIDKDMVRVIGTSFNIDRSADKTTVAVAEGIVSVKGAHDAAPEQITRGQQITVADGNTHDIRNIDIDSSLAWMSGRLVVDQAPVSDVIATLSRHSSSKFYVRGKLRDRKISGTFSLEDIDGSLGTIAAALNATIIRNIPFVTVIY